MVLSNSVFAAVELSAKIGKKIDLSDYTFTDESNQKVNLDELGKTNPLTIIVPVYYGCPGFCTMTLNTFFSTLKKSGRKTGDNLQVIIFSINPEETAELALKKKKAYLKQYSLPDVGIHFLVGKLSEINSLTNELGFKYEKSGDQYAHPAAIYLLDKKEKIAKVFNGERMNPRAFRIVLAAAAGGKKISAYENMVRICANLYTKVADKMKSNVTNQELSLVDKFLNIFREEEDKK